MYSFTFSLSSRKYFLANTKKMSYFSGCCHLIVFSTMMAMIFLQTSMAFDEEDVDSFHEFSSREELVRLAGYGEDKLSTVLITGTLVCDGTQLPPSPVSGALVGMNCGKWSQQSSIAAVVTDEYGEFQIDLPSHLHAIPELDKACLVEVVRMPKNSACNPAFDRGQKTLMLLIARHGVRIYTAGEVELSLFKEEKAQR